MNRSASGTVLYIEDTPANLKVVEHSLKRLSHVNVETAMNGQNGLHKAREIKPDLVLVDIQLPDMDGYTILRALRENPETQSIPVYAISANAMSGDIQKGLDAGFDDYITKPIDIHSLIDKVANLLSGNN